MTDDDADKPVWGAPNIAKVINKSTDATEHLLAKRRVDASKVGKIWMSTRRRLYASLSKPVDRAG